jgi:hypothetical protein
MTARQPPNHGLAYVLVPLLLTGLSVLRPLPGDRPISHARRDAWQPRITTAFSSVDISDQASVSVAWIRMAGEFSRVLKAAMTALSSLATSSAEPVVGCQRRANGDPLGTGGFKGGFVWSSQR